MYFVAIVLPKELDDEVLVYKRRMYDIYGCKVGLKSPAHITLVAPFKLEDDREIDLRNDLQTISSKFSGFSIETNNFASFGNRTIFIDVKITEALFLLKKETEDYLISNGYNIRKESRPFHPHITIATRDLKSRDFCIVRPYFDTKTFNKSFVSNGISLLKHNSRHWDVVSTSVFNS